MLGHMRQRSLAVKSEATSTSIDSDLKDGIDRPITLKVVEERRKGSAESGKRVLTYISIRH